MGCFNSNTTEGGKSGTNDMAAALPKLTAKLNELIARRDSQTPRVIAKGNYCSNPCYEFNLNLVNECPKCKGKVIMEYENEYTIKKDYNREGREIEKKFIIRMLVTNLNLINHLFLLKIINLVFYVHILN